MKSKRKIKVDGELYIWALEGNDAYSSNRWIIVTLYGTSHSRLYIDPYEHDFEIKPSSIAMAIRAARKMGWVPEKNSSEMRIAYSNGTFSKKEST